MSIFQDQEDIAVIDETKDFYAELTGPGGKFHREDEAEAKKVLARAKVESDAYISRLEKEMAGLRQELKSRVDSEASAARLAELVDRLAQAKQEAPANTNLQTNETRDRGEFTPEKLEEFFDQRLQRTQAQQRAAANQAIVVEKLKEKFGSSYAQHVRSQADSLRISVERMEALAAEAPDAFLRLVGVDAKQEKVVNPPMSSVNTSGFQPDVSGQRDESYYEKMKQTDPVKYWNKNTQHQLHKDALALGEAFFTKRR